MKFIQALTFYMLCKQYNLVQSLVFCILSQSNDNQKQFILIIIYFKPSLSVLLLPMLTKISNKPKKSTNFSQNDFNKDSSESYSKKFSNKDSKLENPRGNKANKPEALLSI